MCSSDLLPSFQQVRQDFASSESLLLDRQGVVIHRLRTNPQVRRGQWVALADISPALRVAMVLSEDKRFYEHSGVDWRAAGAAAWGNLWNKRTRGASTLTMQLVGLVDEDLQRSQGRRRRVPRRFRLPQLQHCRAAGFRASGQAGQVRSARRVRSAAGRASEELPAAAGGQVRPSPRHRR